MKYVYKGEIDLLMLLPHEQRIKTGDEIETNDKDVASHLESIAGFEKITKKKDGE
ncbi:hypothetical protein [Priestia megaterium]|uniref:hypothetical protein n=1 Tax=Priestia megaterium TaxID=1404 RepID=UPI0015CF5779|nr:hypothetical protein [Priestia megaterium]